MNVLSIILFHDSHFIRLASSHVLILLALLQHLLHTRTAAQQHTPTQQLDSSHHEATEPCTTKRRAAALCCGRAGVAVRTSMAVISACSLVCFLNAPVSRASARFRRACQHTTHICQTLKPLKGNAAQKVGREMGLGGAVASERKGSER